MKKTCSILLALFMVIGSLFGFRTVASASSHETTVRPSARPSLNGHLRVDGCQLVDENGEIVQLRGVSTHGLTWYPDFINDNLFKQISEDWNCDLVRLAMYSDIYAEEDREESLRLMRKGIDAAIKADMYVIVDWHILNDADPNIHIDAAKEFFSTITTEYGEYPNLIYEICNEPNGQTGWSDVLRYSDVIIPLIREKAPDSVILVGTPQYDRSTSSAVMRPLPYDNLLYVLHFYAASHKDGLMDELKAAVDAGLPVFISECGLTEESGDGTVDFASAFRWFYYLNEHNISYAIWNFSDKDETSSFFKPGFDQYGKISDNDLTVAGSWARELIRGHSPEVIYTPAAVVNKSRLRDVFSYLSRSLGSRSYQAVLDWPLFALCAIGIVWIVALFGHFLGRRRRYRFYDEIYTKEELKATSRLSGKKGQIAKLLLLMSICSTLIYMAWRVFYSIPLRAGWLAIAMNLILLSVEILGFLETLVLYRSLFGLRNHPLPKIPDDAWPDVDIFIATYNEPTELLRRTVNGCRHIRYPDQSKVHIWICDDNRRGEMRALAEEMGVGYFDRPDNKGAKAGNLNNALARTSAPYVVTLDADMIPRSDFLLKTIPFFVDAEIRNKDRDEKDQIHLGLLQTPQCFYDPDVFQHALYSERRAPNEQDFFYRTIEPSRTSTNSVIYGGSNTILSRQALKDIGGFFTETITEDFATGILIESHGYVSLALPEPLASGQTPHTFKEHIKQRTRWGRGVIATARQLKIFRRKELSFTQKVSYWSSVVYWYSPIKNLIYMISPLMFAVLAVPVFACNWLELLIFWLPMYLLQEAGLRAISGGQISQKWSGIYETGVMAHLILPITKEMFGMSLTTFKVTDKSGKQVRRESAWKDMIPFLFLILFSLAGITRVLCNFEVSQTITTLILLFWLLRNMYFLITSLFLIDGRESDAEPIRVFAAEFVTVSKDGGSVNCDGVTTQMTEHNLTVFLDEGEAIAIGEPVEVKIDTGRYNVRLTGTVTGVQISPNGIARTHTIEILDFCGTKDEYLQILYDRIPTLPQTLQRDFGLVSHIWQNIAHRVARTRA